MFAFFTADVSLKARTWTPFLYDIALAPLSAAAAAAAVSSRALPATRALNPNCPLLSPPPRRHACCCRCRPPESRHSARWRVKPKLSSVIQTRWHCSSPAREKHHQQCTPTMFPPQLTWHGAHRCVLHLLQPLRHTCRSAAQHQCSSICDKVHSLPPLPPLPPPIAELHSP